MPNMQAAERSPPSTSATVKLGPKSVNTLAKTPLTSALIKAMPFLWQKLLSARASFRGMLVATTTCSSAYKE